MPDSCQFKSEVKPDYNGFFDRVKEAMELENAPKIAKRLGLEKQSVYGWSRGSLPRVETLSTIAEIGQVSLHWLITGEGPKKAPPGTIFLPQGYKSDTSSLRAIETIETAPPQALSQSNNPQPAEPEGQDLVRSALKALIREVLIEEGIIEPKRD